MTWTSASSTQSKCAFTARISLQYLLYLPLEYPKTQRAWPLILYLHGKTERGRDLDLVKNTGLARIAEKRDSPFVVVCPQCPPRSYWSDFTVVLLHLLDHVCRNLRVDVSQIYLTGNSMGGFGAWSLAIADAGRFAAIAPICGGGVPRFATMLGQLPIWAFHGKKDYVVPLSYSRQMVDAVRAAGGNARLTVYPDLGHDCWTRTYERDDLYRWFLANARISTATATTAS